MGRAVQHVGMCSDFPITPLALSEALFLIAACFGSTLVQHPEQILLAPPHTLLNFKGSGRENYLHIVAGKWGGKAF